MKKKNAIIVIVLFLLACIVNWMGIGYAPSGSAIQDLRTEMETIYGTEYTGKETENGLQDMKFEVVPKSFFFTNWNLRNTLGVDYQYVCKVIFTDYSEDGRKVVHTVTYPAIDPMGKEHTRDRAHLLLSGRSDSEEKYD